jgi:hypothetical protein
MLKTGPDPGPVDFAGERCSYVIFILVYFLSQYLPFAVDASDD